MAELKRRHRERLPRVRPPSPDRPKAEAVAEGAGEEVAEVDETSTRGDRLEVVDEEVHQAVVATPRLLLLKSDRQAAVVEAEEVVVEEGEAVVEEEDQARPRNDKQSPAKLEA